MLCKYTRITYSSRNHLVICIAERLVLERLVLRAVQVINAEQKLIQCKTCNSVFKITQLVYCTVPYKNKVFPIKNLQLQY